MRFFELVNLQDMVLYFSPAVLAILILGLALGYVHFRTVRSEERMKKPYHTFPEDIEDRQAPFPLSLILIMQEPWCGRFSTFWSSDCGE